MDFFLGMNGIFDLTYLIDVSGSTSKTQLKKAAKLLQASTDSLRIGKQDNRKIATGFLFEVQPPPILNLRCNLEMSSRRCSLQFDQVTVNQSGRVFFGDFLF